MIDNKKNLSLSLSLTHTHTHTHRHKHACTHALTHTHTHTSCMWKHPKKGYRSKEQSKKETKQMTNFLVFTDLSVSPSVEEDGFLRTQ